jgi:hypothetical protein
MGEIAGKKGGEVMQDLIVTFTVAGFGLVFGFMLIIYNSMQSGFKKLESKIDNIDNKLCNKIDVLDTKLSNRIDKLDDKVTDIDRRLSRIEGAFSVRDRCALNHDIGKEAV